MTATPKALVSTESTTSNHAIGTASSGRRDRAAMVLLATCAAGALIATAVTAGELADARGAAQLPELWKLVGLPVFAGIFVLLARAPRRLAGLWELVILNKVALVVAGATVLSDVEGADEIVVIDGALVALLVGAYVLTQGWTAWSRR